MFSKEFRKIRTTYKDTDPKQHPFYGLFFFFVFFFLLKSVEIHNRIIVAEKEVKLHLRQLNVNQNPVN